MISDAIKVIRPGASWDLNGDTYDGLVWKDKAQSKPSQEEVEKAIVKVRSGDLKDRINVERDRRIALGARVTLGALTFVVQTRDDKDFRNVNGLASKGIVLKLTGGSATTTPFRDAQDRVHMLNADALISMSEQVAAHVSHIYARSWELKDMTTIPADYQNDKHWI